MNRIKELPKSSAQLLSSTQIISSVQSVVKELVENSLDSSATNIEVKLDDFGLEKIEVKDNGKGILKEDIPFVAKPHCTSKINSHLDLYTIETYGFRGEALSALCSVSSLTITTKAIGEDLGFTYTFDCNGNVLTTKPCPCNQGTSVVVLQLFKNIPVRRQFYGRDKNKKEDLKKIEDILVAFGCIQTSVRFMLFHNRSLIWQKPSVNKAKESLVYIFGNQVVDHMENCEFTDDETQIHIELFLPKPKAPLICSQSSLSRCIIAINKRPVRMKDIDKLLKEYYNREFEDTSKARYPICYVDIKVPAKSLDVNFEPNKTAVALENNNLIVDQLSKFLSTFYTVDSHIENITTLTKNTEPTIPAGFQPLESNTVSTAKIADHHNTSTNSSFQTKLSQIAPDFKKTTFSKLSRKRDFDPLPNKKRKSFSSSSFSTPPNDIYRHINTLKSFLDSTNAEKNVPDSETTVQKENSNSQFKETPILNNQFSEVTVQRTGTPLKPTGLSDTVNEVSILSENKLQKNEESETLVISKNFDGISSGFKSIKSLVKNNALTAIQNNNRNGVNKEVDSMNNNSANLKIKVNGPFEKPSAITLGDLNKLPDKDVNFHQTTTINIEEWSKGLYLQEKNIKPVTILNSKNQVSDKTVKLNEVLGCKAEGSPNQRKVTPFHIFCRSHRLEVASLHPDYNNHQLAQILSEKWSNLSSKDKDIYKNKVSDDSPRRIKNNESPSIVNEDLKLTREKIPTTKKVRKMKRKNKEYNYVFSMGALKNCVAPKTSCKSTENDLKIICCLSPGIWLCSQQSKLYLLNCFRLQETVVYQRLLETYKFDPEPLDSPLLLTAYSLGDEGIKALSKMQSETDYKNECFIINENLYANGFKIKVLKCENENKFEVIGITSSIAFYGISDLKEIISIVTREGPSVALSTCRPGKTILYLQGEAVRIARQYQASKDLEDVQDLIDTNISLLSTSCIHHKPILHEFYTLPILK